MTMYIGKVATLCDVSVKTIRYYESLGLLPAVKRKGAYRVFSERDVRLIRLIKQVQSLGFRLSEIKAALESHDHALPWDIVCQLVREKEIELSREIERLTSMSDQLRAQREDIEDCLAQDPACTQLLP